MAGSQRRDHGEAMRRATALTRQGRVGDATAAIQRSLARAPAPAAAAGGRQPSAPGDAMVAGAVTTAAGSRAYRLHVPPTAGAATALGLVVLLHGCSQDADDVARGTRMNALADRHGFLVAYPEQSQQANPSRCWNWFRAEDQRRGAGEPAIIVEMVRRIAAEHPVDRRRVHVAGMSAGAAMARVLAATHPDVFAAVGMHSGLPYGVARDLPTALQAMKHGGAPAPSGAPAPVPVPVIAFHGDADRTVHPANAAAVLRQATAHVADVTVTSMSRVDGGRSSTVHVHTAGDGQVLAEGWQVHGLGHAWSGGDPAGSWTDPAGPDASAQMVRFFTEHPGRD